jgi:hypothetical protein
MTERFLGAGAEIWTLGADEGFTEVVTSFAFREVRFPS